MDLKQQILHEIKLINENNIRLIKHVEKLTSILDKEKQTKKFTVQAYLKCYRNTSVDTLTAMHIGQKVTSICNKFNIPIEKIPDTRYGKVNVYDVTVLEAVINKEYSHLMKAT